jgi:transposase
VCYRQAKRLKKAYESGGIQALAHGNKGRSPANKLDDELRQLVVELSRNDYADFNDTHFTEILCERKNVSVSRQTVRTIRRDEGIAPKRKRRAPKHHKRRLRKAAEGLMILWDGSPHRWFGREYDPCCLMAAIDDATSKVLALFFVEHECSAAYLGLLGRVVRRHGVPGCVYQDRHSSLKRNDDFWSIEEQLAGRQDPTQVGSALEALSIESIFAQTPQAKGRVERAFGTLQDRLVAMLALEQITDIEKANAYLEESFLDYYNELFAVPAEQAQSVWRKLPRGLDLDRVLSLRYEAIVANDNAIRFDGMVIDVSPGPNKRSYAGVRAELRQLLDGSWRVYHQDKLIACAPATKVVEPIRARHRRKGMRAAVDSQWIYWASAPKPQQAQPVQPHSSSTARIATSTVRRAGPGAKIGATRIA